MRPLTALGAGAAVAALWAHAATYWPFFADDGFISLRYSVRWVAGLGLTWASGAPVEGYSNPLWVIACAAAIAVGVAPIVAARGLGLVTGAVAVGVIGARSPGAGVVAALSGSLAVWAIAGLEQPMVAMFLALALALLLPRLDDDRPLWPAGLALAGLVLSRPDSPLFVAIATVAVAIWRGPRAAATLLAAPLGAWLAWEVFRVGYYDDWVPNTAYAKVSPSWARFADGAGWVGRAMAYNAPLVAGSLLAARRWRARPVQLLAALTVGWHLYVAWIGGDIFPAWRHFAPAAVLHAWLFAEGLVGLRRAGAVAAGAAVAMVAVGAFDPENERARDEDWEWSCATIATDVGRGFAAERPLLGADPAGCWPYFSGLDAVDLYGLNDRWLAHHPPADLGSAWIGHGLGDGTYVWERKVDLLVFCSPWGGAKGCGKSGKELLAMPAFKQGYRMLTFAAGTKPRDQSKIWTRIDGPLGPKRDGDGWIVPGWWLAADGATARLDAGGRMVAVVDGTARVKLPIDGAFTVDVPGMTGTWADGELRVTGRGEVAAVRLLAAGPPPAEGNFTPR